LQVKGIEYHISDFLGITPPTVRPGNALYSAVLYLSPGEWWSPNIMMFMTMMRTHGCG